MDQHIDKRQNDSHTLELTSAVYMTCMCMDVGRKLEHTSTMKLHKVNTDRF